MRPSSTSTTYYQLQTRIVFIWSTISIDTFPDSAVSKAQRMHEGYGLKHVRVRNSKTGELVWRTP